MKKKTAQAESVETTDGTFEFYTNANMVGLSVFEFGLKHLLLDENQQVKGAINVRMSPQSAKLLSILLEKNVAKYEEEYGELHIPEEMLKFE